MDNLELQAAKVAEKSVAAWRHSTAPRSEVGIPLGVIASLILMDQLSEQDSAGLIEQWDDQQIAEAMLTTWSMFTIMRPELAFRVGPMAEWLNREPLNPHLRGGAADVARAAVKSGLFQLIARSPVGFGPQRRRRPGQHPGRGGLAREGD